MNLRNAHKHDVSALVAMLYLNDFPTDVIPVYQPDTNVYLSGARGARIFIHDAGTYPHLSSGFDVTPGTSVQVN